jgi:HK97 family phage prohead protease
MNKEYNFKFNFPVILKSDSKGDFFLEGYCATTDLDRQDEIILTTALEKALEDVRQNRTVFYEHKSDQFPIGKVVDTKIVQENGSSKLYVKVYISKTAETVRTLIEEGILNKFSIGGKVLKYKKANIAGKDVTEIEDMELYEVSVVGLPANLNADVIGFEIKKSLELNKEEKQVEKTAEELQKEKDDVLAKSIEEQKQKDEVKAAEELKKAEELKAAEELKKAEDIKASEAKKQEELQVLDAKVVMDTLSRMETMIQQMVEGLKNIKVEIKKEELPVQKIEASVKMDEVEGLIKKAVDAVKEELIKTIKITPTRKGLVIQDSVKDVKPEEEIKPADAEDPITVLEDPEKFGKLGDKEKSEVIRKGFLNILQRAPKEED